MKYQEIACPLLAYLGAGFRPASPCTVAQRIQSRGFLIGILKA